MKESRICFYLINILIICFAFKNLLIFLVSICLKFLFNNNVFSSGWTLQHKSVTLKYNFNLSQSLGVSFHLVGNVFSAVKSCLNSCGRSTFTSLACLSRFALKLLRSDPKLMSCILIFPNPSMQSRIAIYYENLCAFSFLA